MAVILPSVYKDGTATVAAGGVVVTGQNTLWLKSLLPGDFFGVHKGFSVRIVSVDSNTQLTLANAWPGAAQAAAAYEIMLQSDVARYSEALRQLLEKLSGGNVEALAGLVGAANKFPFFTNAGTMDVGDVSPFARSNVLNKTDRGGLLDALGVSPSLQKLAPLSTNLNLDVTDGWVVASGPGVNCPTNAGEWFVQIVAWPNGTHVIQTAWRAFLTGSPRYTYTRQKQNDGSWTAWIEQVQQSFQSIEQGGGAGQEVNKVRMGWHYNNTTQLGGLKAQVDAVDLGIQWSGYNCASSLGGIGWQRFGSGLMIQWGNIPGGTNGDVFVTFPVAFAVPPAIVHTTAVGAVPNDGLWFTSADFYAAPNFLIRRRYILPGGGVAVPVGNAFGAVYLAIGRWY